MENKDKVFKVCFECLNCGDVFIKEYPKAENISEEIGAYISNSNEVITCEVCDSDKLIILKRMPLL